MRIAITRAVPDSIAECELTHLARTPIDFGKASDQHGLYEEALASLGCTVVRAPTLPDLPDSVFVEDVAVVLPEIAIITRPGADSRVPEVETIASLLREFRPLSNISGRGRLDGGDVLCVSKRIYVGIGGRSNAEGVRQLKDIVTPLGYSVEPVRVSGCLHVKTAVTQIAERMLLINPSWVDPAHFAERELIEVHPAEPFAGNALKIGDALIYPAEYPRTHDRLADVGIPIHTIPTDELAKAEAGVTCCSIVIEQT